MPAPNILPVILCGGDGIRLWPLSRQGYPKQFLSLFGDRSLLELTLERLAAFGQLQAIAVEQHRFLINEASEHAGVPINQILDLVGEIRLLRWLWRPCVLIRRWTCCYFVLQTTTFPRQTNFLIWFVVQRTLR